MAEIQIKSFEQIAAEMRDIANRYDDAETYGEQRAVAKEMVDTAAKELIRNMLAKVTPEHLAAYSIQQFARHFAA